MHIISPNHINKLHKLIQTKRKTNRNQFIDKTLDFVS